MKLIERTIFEYKIEVDLDIGIAVLDLCSVMSVIFVYQFII